jgi:hypothetical protein
MSDEERWGVLPGRREALASHNTSVRNNGRDDAILYYPGSGTDILHALFAAGAKARYFIFVDPADLDQSMSAHLKEKHSRLNTTEASPILGNLGISSRSAGGWMFSMQGRMRYLFHFRMAHNAFVAANRGFVCDIVFEKDFWETPDDVDLGDVLAMLRIGGHYSTNASLGILIPAMPLVGLDYVNTYQINGDQSLFRRRTATRLNWNDLGDSLRASRQVVYGLINDEKNALYYDGPQDEVAIGTELTNKKAKMLEPFTKKGITVPVALCNPLCRQIAIWAVGGAAQQYIGGIDRAFPCPPGS